MAGDTFCAQYEVIRVIEQGLCLFAFVFLSDDYALEDVEVFCQGFWKVCFSSSKSWFFRAFRM